MNAVCTFDQIDVYLTLFRIQPNWPPKWLFSVSQHLRLQHNLFLHTRLLNLCHRICKDFSKRPTRAIWSHPEIDQHQPLCFLKFCSFTYWSNCVQRIFYDRIYLLAFLYSGVSDNNSTAFSTPLKFGIRLNTKFPEYNFCSWNLRQVCTLIERFVTSSAEMKYEEKM